MVTLKCKMSEVSLSEPSRQKILTYAKKIKELKDTHEICKNMNQSKDLIQILGTIMSDYCDRMIELVNETKELQDAKEAKEKDEARNFNKK